MGYDDNLKIYAGIDTAGVDSGMKDVKSLIDKGMSAIKSTTSAGASVISTVTKAVTGAVTAASSGVIAFGGYATSVGKNFESSMSQVIATMGITKDTIEDGVNSYDRLAETAKLMGETTKFSASEAADALNYLALAGYDAEKACKALPAVLNLAQAGGMDLAYTSDLVTDAMSALGMEATNENLTHFGDSLAKTASRSNTSVAQLGEAILVCGGQAKLAGLDLEEMNTMLGILADNGIKGSEGGTALRNLLKNMYTPTSQASKAMEALNVQFSDTEGNLKPVQDVLMETMSALENLTEADKIQAMGDIFDTRTIAAASAALNNSSERFNELYAEVSDCDGAMAKMAQTMNDNLQGDLYGLQSAAEAVGVSVYENLNLSLRNATQLGTSYLRDLNSAFKEHGFDGLASEFGDVLGDVVTKASDKVPELVNIGSSVVDSFISGISKNADKLGTSGAEVITVIATCVIESLPEIITAGGDLVYSFVDGITQKYDVLSEKAGAVVSWIYDKIVENLPKMIDTGLELVEKFGQGISDNSEKIVSSGVEIIKILADGVKKGIPKIVKVAKQIVKDFVNALEKEVPALKPFTQAIEFIADNFEILASLALGAITALKGFKIITSVAQAIKGLGTALNFVVGIAKANPVGLALGIAGGIATALISFEAFTKDYETAVDKAITKEQEYITEIKERKLEYQDMLNSAMETAAEDIAPLERVSSLADELNNLADASGRVNEKDFERVNYILQTLNETLGTDYSLVDGQIQKYDELKDSIAETIEMKRAEILISANEDAYKQALIALPDIQNELVQKKIELENQNESIRTLAKELGYSLQELDDVYSLANGDFEDMQLEYQELVDTRKINADEYDFDAWITELDLLQEEADLYKELQKSYSELDDEVNTYYADIEKYEQASQSFANKKYSEAERIITEGIDVVKSAKTATKQSIAEISVMIPELEKKVQEREVNFDTLKEKYENGISGVTESVVQEAETKLEESKTELNEAYQAFAEYGVQGYEDKLNNTDLSESTQTFADSLKSLISSHKQSIYDEGSSIAESMIDGLSAGMVNLGSVQTAVASAVSSITTMMKEEADINSPSKLMRDEVGRWLLPGVAVGVEDTVSSTTADIGNSLNQVMSGLDADAFVSRADSILSGFGNSSVPQYSQVYETVSKSDKNSNNSFELPSNNANLSPKINVFIGDSEIKDFVISTIDEANAVSGGATF